MNRIAPLRNKPNDMMGDERLIRAVSDGDDGALRELFDRHAPWIAARLRRAMPAHAVEDVLQETFIAVWHGAKAYRGTGAPGAWIWGIGRNQAAMWARKNGRTEPVLQAAWISDPATDLVQLDVFVEVPSVALQQGLWFCGVGTGALAAVVVNSRRGDAASWTLLAGALLLCAGGFAASMVTPHLQGFVFADKAAHFEYVCEEGEITVCLHPAYEKLLPQAAEVVNEVGEPLVGILGAPTRAVQVGSLSPEPGLEARNIAFFAAQGLVEEGDVGWFEEEAAMGLVESPAVYEGLLPEVKPTEEDLRRCGTGVEERFVDPTLEARAVIANWLLRQLDWREPGFSLGQCPDTHKLLETFAELDPAKRRAWLEEHLADLRAGKVTLRDLP